MPLLPRPVPDGLPVVLGAFIGCPLDYAQIRRAAIGAVAQPNTAFPNFNGPFIGRWKALVPPSDARRLEEMIAPTLEELGYPPELAASGSGRSLASWRMRTAYHSLFRCKKWLKRHVPFNRMVRLNPLRPGSLPTQ